MPGVDEMKQDTIEFIDRLIKEQQGYIKSAKVMVQNSEYGSRKWDDAMIKKSNAERMIENYELIKTMEDVEE